MKGAFTRSWQCMQVVYFFNCCSIHKLYYGHFCFSPYAVNAIFNFSCVCVVSNRFLLVPLSQWCRLAVRKYIHIIFFHWYLIYLKVNIYIYHCDFLVWHTVCRQKNWYILVYFFVIFCSFSPLITQGTHTFICKLHMEIKMWFKILPVLFLNLLLSKVKRCNALFYVVCLAFHCWFHAVVIIVSRFTVGY